MVRKQTRKKVTKKENVGTNKIFKALGIFVLLILLTSIISGCTSLLLPSDSLGTGNVAVIPMHGPIMIGEDSYFGTGVVHPDVIREMIIEAEQNDQIEAIVLEINSGGGAPVASAEIAEMIASTTKPTVAQIREVGASGAYWIAASADHIIANEISITGSIGVIGSYLEFSGFLDDYNITYNRQVAGKYKDLGSPFKEMTQEENDLNQRLLVQLHQIFIREVAQHRNMTFEEVEVLAQGQVFLGFEAMQLGLVDELGSQRGVELHLERLLDKEVEFVRYEQEKSFFDSLSLVQSDFGQEVGYGLGERLLAQDGGFRPELR